ncbi:conserved hypothetical protein [Enterobacterales bacterium 8AC]|nr:conserved hypothetical protein [Enterobacterales bacterium 8AC]
MKIEQQKRAKADAENEKLRKALENNGCSNQQLPDDVRRILRRETEAAASPAADLRVSTSSATPAV